MALDMQETHAKSYELCGADRYTYNELLDAVGKAVGRKFVPKVRNPLGLMKLITPILQQFKQYPVTMDQIQMLTEESICDSLWRDTFRFELSRLENIIPGYLSKASSHVE
jgi:NADH dehydrogenase